MARGFIKDRPFRAALLRQLEDADVNGRPNPYRMDRIAHALLHRASMGDVSAIKEVADRIDGKVPTPLSSDPDNPLELRVIETGIRRHYEIEQEVVAPLLQQETVVVPRGTYPEVESDHGQTVAEEREKEGRKEDTC